MKDFDFKIYKCSQCPETCILKIESKIPDSCPSHWSDKAVWEKINTQDVIDFVVEEIYNDFISVLINGDSNMKPSGFYKELNNNE